MTLPTSLLETLHAARWHLLKDSWQGGAAPTHAPSVDLAVCLFRPGQPLLAANVLGSREGTFCAELPADFGAAKGVAFQCDLQDAQGRSMAWLPDADWSRIRFTPLYAKGWRFVAPYPASLLKLMLAAGLCAWLNTHHETDPDATLNTSWCHDGQSRPLRDWQHDMISLSCNRSTDALVAWSHAHGLLPTALPELLRALDLPTLGISRTRPRWGLAQCRWRRGRRHPHERLGQPAPAVVAAPRSATLPMDGPASAEGQPCALESLAEQQLPGLVRGRRFAHTKPVTPTTTAPTLACSNWARAVGRSSP